MKRSLYYMMAILALIVITSTTLIAEVKLPAIFGDNMVLQRETQAAVWGKAASNSSVRVTTSWNNKSYTANADKVGNWKLKVSTPVAGGPYSITISDGKTLTLKNVMIGEVWVCSGQSNMEVTMKGYRNQPVAGSNEYIATSSNEQIRLFTVQHAVSLTPLDTVRGSWKLCEPENVSNFSATAYLFGLRLNKILKVPIGLISSAWGGTKIEPWISDAGFTRFDWIKLPDKTQKVERLSQQTPTVLFNGMINAIVGFGIRGAIWYQGEANIGEPEHYQKLLPGLVENWRSLWGVGDFPFYYVQIAPYDYGPDSLSSAYLREAQLKASTALPNIGMACVMDIAEQYCIHPANKAAGANRLADLALIKTYGLKGFACEGPVFKEMTINGNMIRLTFDNAPNGLTSYGKDLSNFEIAGQNRRFMPATAFITNFGVTVFSPFVNNPVAVRYAFKDFAVGDLFNTEGFPASSFRTDTWEYSRLPITR